MPLLLAVGLILTTIGVLLLFRVNAKSFEDAKREFDRSRTLFSQSKIRKKKSHIRQGAEDVSAAMTNMGQGKNVYYVALAVFVLLMAGLMSGLSFGNVFLGPVFALLLAVLPYLFIRLRYAAYQKLLLAELESGLSVITSCMERGAPLQSAVEECVADVDEPLRGILLQFLHQVKRAGRSPADALEDMKSKIRNPVFAEWADCAKKCLQNRTLVSCLRPLVDKLLTLRLVTAKADNLLREVKGDFRLISILSIVILLLGYFVLPMTAEISLRSGIADFLAAVNLLVILFMNFRVMIMTRDLKLR